MEEGKFIQRNRLLRAIAAVIGLYIFQIFAGKAGWAVADLLPYKGLEFYEVYGRISVHHMVFMIAALAVIAVLKRLLKLDFGFKVGDRKKGMKYVSVYAASFAAVAVIYHILMFFTNQLPVYNYPLNAGNVTGTLCFQMFLTGPAEETLYRALPVTVLVYLLGKKIHIKWNITLEIVLASILFSLAHGNLSLFPFAFEADYFQLLYAFVLGTIQGIAYQESGSILYPILMHSLSNFLMVGTGYLFALMK